MTQAPPKTKPIDRILQVCPDATGPHGAGDWYTNPDNPRFDFREREDGSILIHSWTSREPSDILAMIGLNERELFLSKRPSTKVYPPIDVVSLAYARRIHWKFLHNLGITDGYKYHGRSVVRIPYHLANGTEHTKMKVRTAIDGDYKHYWNEGTPGEIIPYGLDKLLMAYEQEYLLIGEGESDAWACWYHNIPYLGIPGASVAGAMVRVKESLHLDRIPRIYILHEPDQVKKLQNSGVGFYKDVYLTLRQQLGYAGEIFCIEFQRTGYKDPGELHIKLWEQEQAKAFTDVIARACASAIPDGDGTYSSDAPATDQMLCSFDPDDSGNGDAMLALFGLDFLWCSARGWFRYTGTHWELDADGSQVKRKAVETLRRRRHAAVDAEKEAIVKCTKADESKVNGCVSRFKTLVSVNIDEFDSDPDLVNCQNGVVDLRTGQITPHNRKQRFTSCLPVPYEPTDDRELTDYLAGVIGGGQEVIDYLQMAVGYAFTGHTREETLFYLHGPTRSGKGTFAETIMALLPSPIATMVDFNSFTAKREGDVSNFDLAPLKPCRIIFASESNRSQSLNPAKIKQLTGGDQVRACFKHKDFFSYRPQFKVWMLSNHPVNGDPDDDALWGRVRVIEFPNSFLGKEDKGKKERLKEPDALKGVLSWIVQGAIKWYALGAGGLIAPEAVVKATQSHRDELDYIQQWLDECCDENEEGWASHESVSTSYTRWCENNNIQYPKGPKGLSQSLKAKGYAVGEVKNIKQANGTTKSMRGVGGLYVHPETYQKRDKE